MAANAVTIYAHQMDDLLSRLGFTTVNIPGTNEVVYAKGFHRLCSDGFQLPLSLRIYTTIEGEASRGVGEDAIHVSVWARLQLRDGDVRTVMVGGSRRVHRVENWRVNLCARLADREELLEPFCPLCSAPMLLRKPKQGQQWQPFFSCIRYNTIASCKGSTLYETKRG